MKAHQFCVVVGILLTLCASIPVAPTSRNTETIKRVHVVFMNHLDVGYSDGTTEGVGYAIDVINRYFTEYFPRAVRIPGMLRDIGYEETFIYTTQPWLVSLYLDCPTISIIGKMLKCPNLTEVNLFGSAVKNGSIAWHAGPMNMQTDNMGAMMFNFSLGISESLDKLFGINRTHATYSQRDVPGLTKATLPILRAHNVKAVSVGVNPGTAPPAVPSPFVWKFDGSDDDGILGFWDKGGYPLNPGPDPRHPGGLARDKCVMADGLQDALCFAFRTDNTGPPTSTQEILSNYEILRAEFPNATIFASTFDRFVASLEKVKSSLPVRHFEIGDTWIQGIASDPFKISMYRAFVRCIETCIEEGSCSFSDPRIFAALRYLIKAPEHTWGAHDFLNHIDWSNGELLTARKKNTPFKETELTWHEQRQFIYLALKSLGNHSVADNVQRAIAELSAARPDLTGYRPTNTSQDFKCNDGTIVRFAVDGSLERLYDPVNNIEWASPNHPLGQLTYNTYVEADFVDMAKQYNYEAGVGYDKPNVTVNAHPEKKLWDMGVISFHQKSDDSCNFWLELKTLDIQTDIKYGAPVSFFLNYVSVPNKGLDVTVLLLNKTTTRLPESTSLNFAPKDNGDRKWSMTKMGHDLDPCNVVLNGSQYVHAVDSTVKFTDDFNSGLVMSAYDSPLIMWGTTQHTPSPFPVPLQPFNCAALTSVAFNLHNNIWNTNYIFWYPYSEYDSSFKSRFSLYFTKF